MLHAHNATCCLQWFNSIDSNKDGQLDAQELQRALATGNLHFSLTTVAHMIRLQNVLLIMLALLAEPVLQHVSHAVTVVPRTVRAVVLKSWKCLQAYVYNRKHADH